MRSVAQLGGFSSQSIFFRGQNDDPPELHPPVYPYLNKPRPPNDVRITPNKQLVDFKLTHNNCAVKIVYHGVQYTGSGTSSHRRQTREEILRCWELLLALIPLPVWWKYKLCCFCVPVIIRLKFSSSSSLITLSPPSNTWWT